MLLRSEIKEGAEILKKKLAEYKPKIAVFNGKGKMLGCVRCIILAKFVLLVYHWHFIVHIFDFILMY